MIKEIVAEFVAGERLDKALAEQVSKYSRSALVKLIEIGAVLVNGEPKQARYKLKAKDTITIDLNSLQRPADSIQLSVLYEDDDVIVINKPAGVLTHSKGDFNKEGTVAKFIQDRLNGDEDWRNSNRAGIVHRLDRGTSGVIICAKNKKTQDYLQGQFSKRNVKKTYFAISQGELPEPEGLIDIPIERNPKKPATFRAGANGKTAQTHFKVLSTSLQPPASSPYSLIELKPITGRTHQLRVHLQYLGNPILGDDFYGGKPAERLMLHAVSLELTLPDRTRQTFSAALPAIFEDYR